MARQRSAKPRTAVRIRSRPLRKASTKVGAFFVNSFPCTWHFPVLQRELHHVFLVKMLLGLIPGFQLALHSKRAKFTLIEAIKFPENWKSTNGTTTAKNSCTSQIVQKQKSIVIQNQHHKQAKKFPKQVGSNNNYSARFFWKCTEFIARRVVSTKA